MTTAHAIGANLKDGLTVSPAQVGDGPMPLGMLRTLGSKLGFHKQEGGFESPFLVSYQAFQLLFENNPHPMWIYDHRTHRFLAINDSAVRNYLYSRGEFRAMTIEQLHSPEDVRRSQLDQAAPDEPVASSLWRHRRKDGTFFDAEVTTHAMTFNGRRAHLVLALDVTARERVQEALRETEDRYWDLFEHANDIVFTTDLRGNFTSFNKAGEIATGTPAEEMLKKNIADFLSAKDLELARSMREQKMAEGGQTTYELQIAGKDGQPVILAVQSSLTHRDGKPTGIRGIARDITERKQLEDRLRQSQKMEALGQLAGGIAHDFNNLLGVIVGFSELLEERLRSESSLHDFAAETLKAGRQAASLTRQLLAFSRRQVLQPKVMDLNDSIASMETLLRRLIPEHIKLTFKRTDRLERIKVDPGQVEQVVLNLAVNARDAMPQGGELTVETRNVVVDSSGSAQTPHMSLGAYVLLAVSDTGVGIDKQTQARLFEPFFTTKQVGQGTGLGLATVYGIVKQSGGYISVESRAGKGTTFNVYLPQTREAVADSDAAHDSNNDVLTGAETVLLVEDAQPLRRLVKLLLEERGYTVLEAQSSPDAARIAASHKGPIDLLLSDIVMPHIDGYQLSDHLRFLRPDMRVLYMSGYAVSLGSHPAGLKSGDVVLTKPFAPASLLRMVRQVLDDSPTNQAPRLMQAQSRGAALGR